MGYPDDTNETLRQARVCLSKVRDNLDSGVIQSNSTEDLADAFEALDGALSTGAPLPDAWTASARFDLEARRELLKAASSRSETWAMYKELFSSVDAWATWRAGQSDYPGGCSPAELALLALVNRAVGT